MEGCVNWNEHNDHRSVYADNDGHHYIANRPREAGILYIFGQYRLRVSLRRRRRRWHMHKSSQSTHFVCLPRTNTELN